MLIVLIYDHVVMGQKLKIGGKLARMVKDNKDALQALLGPPETIGENAESGGRQLPKYAYLRLNKHFKVEAESSDDEDMDLTEKLRKRLKDEGYAVKRVQNMNVI